MEGQSPNRAWPKDGIVEFEGYSTRYREGLDLVLKDVTFKVGQGEKVRMITVIAFDFSELFSDLLVALV